MSAWAEARSIPVPETGCWIWLGCTDDNGYGLVTVKRVVHRAHRLAWSEVNGPITAGLHVLHKCDTPSCINPTHLFVGTNDDNVADKVRKNRQSRGEHHSSLVRKGGEHYNSKLNPESVSAIRSSTERGTTLAERYGVSQATISEVRSRKTWGSYEH